MNNASRRIINKILNHIRFDLPIGNDKDTYYAEYNGIIFRLSDHCMTQNELNCLLDKNPLFAYIPFMSFAIENGKSTSDKANSSMINEYVYDLEWTPNIDVDAIIKFIKARTVEW